MKDWRKAGHTVPPVIITVANQTYTAARIKYAFDHGKIRIDELANPDRTLHIDSKVLAAAEAQDEAAALMTNGDGQSDARPSSAWRVEKLAVKLTYKIARHTA